MNMKYRPAIKLIIVFVIVAVLPLLPTLFAGFIASINGCELHEGFVNPCVILGYDFGEIIYGMGVMFWLALFTIPLGVLGVSIGLVRLVIALYKNKGRS